MNEPTICPHGISQRHYTACLRLIDARAADNLDDALALLAWIIATGHSADEIPKASPSDLAHIVTTARARMEAA
jgi:hypothetical protein